MQRSWYNLPGHIVDLSKSAEGRTRLLMYSAVSLVAFAVGGLIDRTFVTPEQITPEDARFGWNEAIAKEEAPRIAAMMPKFAITDADDNVVSGEGKSAELWRFTKLINEGKHIPTWKQESGDCVSMGWSNAIAYRQGFQIAQDQRNEILKIPFPPYCYGTSRVLIGKRQLGRQPGSVGAWAAQASQAYGVLPTEQANALGYRYSGQLADQWGWQGPPRETITYGSKFRIRTVSQVRTWEDTRDALVHGYPVTVASNVGFTGGPYDRDGKRWLRARGNWGHQMCFIGVEDRPGRVKGAYCLNSWGVDAHPKPLNDEPLGGFWVDWQTVQRMVAQNDSWAYSDFDGFPAEQVADWNAFKSQVEANQPGEHEAELLARSEQPDPQPVLMEVRSMFSLNLLWVCLALGVVLGAVALMAKYGGKAGRVSAALLLAAAMIYGASADVDAGPRRRAARYQAYQAQQVYQAQAATAPACVCPAGACCNGACTNCPANASRDGWKCGPNGCVPPASTRTIERVKTRTIHAASFNAFPPVEVSAPPAEQPPEPTVWSAMPAPEPVATSRIDPAVEWSAFGG
jgi:hypothetical protein